MIDLKTARCPSCLNVLYNVGVTKSFATITYQKFDLTLEDDEMKLAYVSEFSQLGEDADVFYHCGECGFDLEPDADRTIREMKEVDEDA